MLASAELPRGEARRAAERSAPSQVCPLDPHPPPQIGKLTRRSRSSDEPNCSRPCRNPGSRPCISGSFSAPLTRTPMRRTMPGCCAPAASGQAAAPPSAPAIDRFDPRPNGIQSRRSRPRHSRFLSSLGEIHVGAPLVSVRRSGAGGTLSAAFSAAARAPPTGHAAALPSSSAMNSRRPIIRSPRRRGRAASAAFPGRTSWRS